MLPTRLYRVQIQLELHRQWLNRFVGTTFSNRRKGPLPGLHHPFVQRYASTQSRPRTAPLYKPRTSKKRQTKLAESKAERGIEHADDVLAFRQALSEGIEVRSIVAAYSTLSDKSQLSPQDFRKIAQSLHHSFRVEKRSGDPRSRRERIEALVAFAQELVKDVVAGKLPPHGQAHVHLVGFFKESGARDAGVRFWRWLEDQDDRHVSPDVYGAAIELMTVNGAPLSEVEALYDLALSRFPGNFNAYHLLPEAIVPDRNASTTLRGVPIALLQGILTARLLRGDTRGAYLALDTALRLYPDQVPPRFFQLFLEERPLLEAYTVFATACRAGIIVASNQYRQLITALRTSSDLNSPSRHAFAVRAMISTTFNYLSSGGQITQNVLSELVIAMTQFLRLKGVADLTAKQKQRLVDAAMAQIRSSLVIFVRYGVKPGLTAFNSIITNLGGFGHSKQIVGIALSDARALGLDINDVTHRSVVTAAGILGDSDFVTKAWSNLVQAKVEAGQRVDPLDFHVLAKTARTAERQDFAKKQFRELKEQVPSHAHDSIEMALKAGSRDVVSPKDAPRVDVEALMTELTSIESDLALIDEKTKDRQETQDLRDRSVSMTLHPTTKKTLLPEHEMRRLYDELTTEQRPSESTAGATSAVEIQSSLRDLESSATSSPVPSVTAVSSTNIPFGTLRYENWTSINYLLAQAEASDLAYLEAVDRAIVAGAVPPERKLDLGWRTDGADVRSYGLSDRDAENTRSKRRNDAKEWTAEEIRHGRNEVLRLRGRAI